MPDLDRLLELINLSTTLKTPLHKYQIKNEINSLKSQIQKYKKLWNLVEEEIKRLNANKRILSNEGKMKLLDYESLLEKSKK
jgi:cell division protein FtsL